MKQDFIDQCTFCDLDFELYEVARHIITGMIGLTPKNVREECSAILAVLNQKRNIEQAIRLELAEPNSQFFIVEKEFWDSWKDNVNFKGDRSIFAIRQRRKKIIDNLSLIEEGHEYRLRDGINYNEDFIILPKFAFRALSTWYPCNKVLRRAVIKKEINKGPSKGKVSAVE